MPEPYKQHAEIIQLNAPISLRRSSHSIWKMRSRVRQDLVLKPFDTVRVFGRFDFEDAPTITTVTEVRVRGPRNQWCHVPSRCCLFSRSTTPDAQLDDVQSFAILTTEN
jgi:hypothetical protein